MKRIYMLLAAVAIAFSTIAQDPILLVDENIGDWLEAETNALDMDTWNSWKATSETENWNRLEFGNWYFNWPGVYTTPNGLDLEVLGGRYREGATIDILVDDFVVGAEQPGTPGLPLPGAIIFTVPSVMEIEVDSRSGSNTPTEPADRHLYIAEWDIFDEDWKQVSQDFELFWGSAGTESYVWDNPVNEETQIAIRCKTMDGSGENLRVHSFKVWGAVASSVSPESLANVLVYSVPGSKNIRVGGDVVGIQVYNLAGKMVYSSSQRGFQNFSTSSLSNGIYLVKVTDINGLTKVEKVVVR